MSVLDLEGVLVPEIWINVSKENRHRNIKTPLPVMFPDYDEFMRYESNLE